MTKQIWIPLLLLSALHTSAQSSIVIESVGNGSKRYWIIYDTLAPASNNVVVFLHGFGASNPACYGGWIRHLVQSGSTVVFPKFHSGFFWPHTRKFQRHVDANIRDALAKIRERRSVDVAGITFVTHSIGGIIAANLANAYGENNSIKVLGLVLVQPGFRWLKLGQLENYASIDEETYVLVITGEQDVAAADRFARHFWQATPQTHSQQKLWLQHHPDQQGTTRLTATHKDPVSPDSALDGGNRNIVISGAMALGRTDMVDEWAYWRPTDLLLELIASREGWHTCTDVSAMGYAANGQPFRLMTVIRE